MDPERLAAGDSAWYRHPTDDESEAVRVTVTRPYDGSNLLVEPADEDGDPFVVNPDHLSGPESQPTTVIDGIGDSRAETLAEHDINTVGDIIAAGVDGLVEAGLSDAQADRFVTAAQGTAGESTA